MERSNTSLNGRRAAVLEKEAITDLDADKYGTPTTAAVAVPVERQTAPVVTPEADLETEEPTPLVPEQGQKGSAPKRKRPIGLILASKGTNRESRLVCQLK